MADKSLFLSKTFWFSLITGILVAFIPLFPVLAPIKEWVIANSVIIGSVWSVIAIGLRIVTKDKVKLID
jgi:hypothetical protein